MRLTSTSKAAIPNEVSGLSWHWIFQPRWGVLALPLLLALAAYNAGPDKVQKYGDVPPYRETVSYVNQVKRKYQKSKSAAAAKTATPAAPKARASASPAGASATPPSPPPSSAPKTQDP